METALQKLDIYILIIVFLPQILKMLKFILQNSRIYFQFYTLSHFCGG